MPHQCDDFANPCDNDGLHIKAPQRRRHGLQENTTLGQSHRFDAQFLALDIPNEIEVGYSPIGFVHCGRAACRISTLKCKMDKETSGRQLEDPHSS